MFNTLKELMQGIAKNPGMIGDIHLKSGTKIEGFEILSVRDDFVYGVSEGRYAYTIPIHSIDYISYPWGKETSIAKGNIQHAWNIEGESLPGDVIGDTALDTMSTMARENTSGGQDNILEAHRDYLEQVTNYLWSKNKSKIEARQIAEENFRRFNGDTQQALSAIKFRY